MYDTYTYDIKYNVELFYIIMKYGNFPCFVKRNVQKSARLLARWQPKLKNWHAVWHTPS